MKPAQENNSNFTHLHVHTEYSLLDGSNKIKEYVAKVKELGMTSAAITDHGEMFGVIDFYKEAKKQGVKPIIGCEIYVAPGSRFDREASTGEDRYFHLVLLAENNIGYSNLMKIVSSGYVEGFYYRPRVDKEVLQKYSEGIIALSACLAGEIPRNINRNLMEEAKAAALEYKEIFGSTNFFLELQDHGMAEQANVNQVLISMSKELGIDLVATNDIHYTNPEDAYPHEVLLCIQTAKKITDEDRMKYEGNQFYVKSPKEMEALFPYAREAIENTGKIAERCQVEIEFGVTKLPEYDVPEGLTPWEYLNQLCNEGIIKRYGDDAPLHKERLDYELKTISEMGFIDYFIIVWDFIKYAKDNGISVGPGRGSAAGSLVSYCLEITDIDPIHYQLLFERFLNPERISLPDIDIDFCYERRQEVIDYVVEKYGKDRVVQIITFGTMAARGVIRDVGRALDLPYAFVDSIAKMIPTELNITIAKALEQNAELKRAYENEDQVKTLIDLSKRLEGLPRHSSTHAAGVVISKLPVEEYVPLSRSSDGTITTQFAMNTLEELGLLKMDFLGLRTLTVVESAVGLINAGETAKERVTEGNLEKMSLSAGRNASDRGLQDVAGEGKINVDKIGEDKIGIDKIDINKINYQDPQVMNYISTGQTDGIFQIESGGMKKLMKELKPNVLEDLIAAIALYRPGPMDFIPQYIKGKNTAETVVYDCPELIPILEPTYGVIVYQEQVMQIVRDLAGYTLGRSDLLRRAMSKKIAEVMEKERRIFVYGDEEMNVPGCIKNGISETAANRIFDKMLDFAQYAFNKSHAAAYAIISYQTAWLKYYYPAEFMAALLTSVVNHSSKIGEYIYACRQMNIEILPPSINYGGANFTATDGKIRYGLTAIKSLGRPVIDSIIDERQERGHFKNLEDFITRMTLREGPNKRGIDSLIRSGAMDELGGTRKQQILTSLTLVDKVQQEKKHSMSGQITLFDIVDDAGKEEFEIKYPNVGEFSKEELLAFEKEVLGVYVSGHPLDAYEEQWKRTISATTLDFQTEDETGNSKVTDGNKEIVGGMIVDLTIKYTKTNQVMAFITIEDLVGTLEVIVFPRNYEESKQYIEEDNKIFIKGRVATEEDKASKLICEKIIPFSNIKKTLWIQFPNKNDYFENEDMLKECLADSEGNDEVNIFLKEERATKQLPRNNNIRINQEILARLMNCFGEQRVKVVEKPVEMKF